MARKRSKSLDGFPLPIPPEPKTIKLTVIQKCFICQKELLDCPLRKGKPSSIANLIEAAKSRQDDCFRRLHLEGVDNVSVNDIVWHAQCFSSYTSQQNLRYASGTANTEQNEEEIAKSRQAVGKVTRSTSSFDGIDWSKCFICKKKTYKKVTELVNISTFEACQSTAKAASIKNDEHMLHILRSVNHDLIATEAKYHKNCYALYVAASSKKAIKETREDAGKDETEHEKAFRQLLDELKPGLDEGKAYDITSLTERYREILDEKGIASEVYQSKRLKDRLKNRFGETIVFHQQLGRAKPGLIYSSNINLQDVINTYALPQKSENKVR